MRRVSVPSFADVRIIGGAFRGRRLGVPTGPTRPTADRTREAIFNLVTSRLPLAEARVLDLFAGSGALGLEALSRGAAHATFVEQGGAALGTIRKNVAALGVEARCTVVRADALRWLGSASAPYDLILADPPYALPELPGLPGLTVPLLAPDGLLVLEHGGDASFEAHPAHETSRTYGQTAVSLFHADMRNH